MLDVHMTYKVVTTFLQDLWFGVTWTHVYRQLAVLSD